MKKAILIFLLAVVSLGAWAQGPLRFRVRLDSGAASGPVSGRLLVMMTNVRQRQRTLSGGFGGLFGPPVYIAAQEVTSLTPDRPVTFNPDVLAYPAAFSSAPKDDWQV